MTLFRYLLEANIYLTVSYLFYLLLLKKYTFFQQHRYYLLIISLFSFVIPLISGIRNTTAGTASAERVEVAFPAMSSTVTQTRPDGPEFNSSDLPGISVLFYWMVVCIGVLVLISGLIKISRLYYHAEKKKEQGLLIAILPHHRTVFSFGGWLFSHPSFTGNELVLEHEKIHIREKHSLDLLWFELLKVFNWFNPVSYYLLKSVKLNHEFIVDSKLIHKYDPYQYAMLLINHAHGHSLQMCHAAFTTAQLEKRIEKMSCEKSTGRSKVLLLLLLPVILPLMYLSVFTIDKDYALLSFSINKARVIPLPTELRGEATGEKLLSELSDPLPGVDTSAPKSTQKAFTTGKKNVKRISPAKALPDTTSLVDRDNIFPVSSSKEENEIYLKSRYADPDKFNEKDKPSAYGRYVSLSNADTSVRYKEMLKPVSIYPDRSAISSAGNAGEKHSVSLYESPKRVSAFQ